MMYSSCQSIPCGESIPVKNPHAVSVSLPTIQDVVRYEEGAWEVVEKMKSGYPRFFRNHWVQQLVAVVCEKFSVSKEYLVFPLPSKKAYEVLCSLVSCELKQVTFEGLPFVLVRQNDPVIPQIKGYIQNAGLIVSSRQAEYCLYKLGLLPVLFEEKRFEFSKALYTIDDVLTKAYAVREEEVVLTCNGANAIFAVCEGILSKTYKGKKKKQLVQLGWLYLDTMEVIRKRATNAHVFLDVFDLDAFEVYIKENHEQIAAVVSEFVSNPKIECLDVERVYKICKEHEVLLVLDVTLITPFNSPVMDFCDVAVESLSKFACGHADVLMGVIVCKDAQLLSQITAFVIPPFSGEIERLGYEIVGYKERVQKISKQTKQLIAFLSKSPRVSKVMSVTVGKSKEVYQRHAKSFDIPGLVSVVFDSKLSTYYDGLPLFKGPSLGAEFTLTMPYVYLAHYDLMQTTEGRAYLEVNNIDTELLRISVGLEPIEEIIEAFEKVFENEILEI
ncbi:PLP-dependent transferase [Flavobacterium sp.]|uniref:PLP-dependent transferase n=1 Tax=Flavobacterium sp. TaxID=239 RepID=UPI003D0D6D42